MGLCVEFASGEEGGSASSYFTIVRLGCHAGGSVRLVGGVRQ